MTDASRRELLLGAAATLIAPALPAVAATTPAKAPKAAPKAELKTAGVKMIPVDGKYQVWTKRVGNGPLPMLTLHGGPGCTHEYLECFEDFLPQRGVTFYYYDQLGSSYSDQPDDASLWTVDRFREEVEQVRKGLGLDRFVLYGHSWGGMLAIEYALKYPQHLRGLVISDMTAGIKSYEAYAAELRKKLPPETIAILDRYEAKGDYENPEYQEAMIKVVYGKHLCRLDPWPNAVNRTFQHLNAKVYNTMQGPNEFVITGSFKEWDRWADLPKIQVPTLVICGALGTMNPDDIRKMAKAMLHARAAVTPNGSHLEMWDDQQTYMAELTRFLGGLKV